MPAIHRLRPYRYLTMIPLLLLCLVTCGPGAEPTATAPPTAAAEPERLQIEDVFFSPPVPFNGWAIITVVGTLPDGCTEIESLHTSREDDGYGVTVETTRPKGVACTQAAVPFREDVRVTTGSMGAGTYRVYVEGKTYTFTFDEDFTVPLTPDQGS